MASNRNYYLYVVIKKGRGVSFSVFNKGVELKDIDKFTTTCDDCDHLINTSLEKTMSPFGRSDVKKVEIRCYFDPKRKGVYTNKNLDILYSGDKGAFDKDEIESELRSLERDKEFVMNFIDKYTTSNYPYFLKSAAYDVKGKLVEGMPYSLELAEFERRLLRDSKRKPGYKTLRDVYIAIRDYKSKNAQKEEPNNIPENSSVEKPVPIEVINTLTGIPARSHWYTPTENERVSAGSDEVVTAEEIEENTIEYLKRHERELLDLEDDPYADGNREVEPYTDDYNPSYQRGSLGSDEPITSFENRQIWIKYCMEHYPELLDPSDIEEYRGSYKKKN